MKLRKKNSSLIHSIVLPTRSNLLKICQFGCILASVGGVNMLQSFKSSLKFTDLKKVKLKIYLLTF